VPIDCSPASGSAFPLGITTVTCTATDSHNNAGTGTFKVNVLYDFGNGSGGGFAEPVTNGVLNQVKAGAGVPVKFGLGANLGLDIFAAGYPTSRKITCDTQQAIDPIEETVAVSSSGLKYDSASGQYIYNWKTHEAWSGTCRQLVIKLKDGSEHPINFKSSKKQPTTQEGPDISRPALPLALFTHLRSREILRRLYSTSCMKHPVRSVER